jgi:hypothetical protein
MRSHDQSQLSGRTVRYHCECAPRQWKAEIPFRNLSGSDLAPDIVPLTVGRKYLVPKLTVVGNMERTQSPPPGGSYCVHRPFEERRFRVFSSPGSMRIVRLAFAILHELESRQNTLHTLSSCFCPVIGGQVFACTRNGRFSGRGIRCSALIGFVLDTLDCLDAISRMRTRARLSRASNSIDATKI